jgi:hypothetical protein
MDQDQHLAVVDSAQRDAEEITHPNIDRHPHAADGTAQNDAFAMKFDMPDAVVRTGVVRVEADGQRMGVEP